MKAAVCALVMVVGVGVAEARPSGSNHARKANALAAAGKCKQAIPEYNAAYAILLDPALLFNRAECLRKVGLRDQALYDYKRFLSEMPDAPNRKLVESRIHEIDPSARIAPPKAVVELPQPKVAPAEAKHAEAKHAEPKLAEPVAAPPTLQAAALRQPAPLPEPAPVRLPPARPPVQPASELHLSQRVPPAPAPDRTPWLWMSAAAVVVAAAALGAVYVTSRPQSP
jgi:hypothetical protein